MREKKKQKTYGIDRFQKRIPKDVKGEIAPGLDSAVGEAVAQIRVG